MEKNLKIYVPTMLVAKVKGYLSEKILFIVDFYDLNDIPVYQKSNFEKLNNDSIEIFKKDEKFSIIMNEVGFFGDSSDEKILRSSAFNGGRYFPSHTLSQTDRTVSNLGFGYAINPNGKSFICPYQKKNFRTHEHAFDMYVYNQKFLNDKVTEIIYDERKEIEAHLSVIKKDMFYIEDENGKLELCINVPMPRIIEENEINNNINADMISGNFTYGNLFAKNAHIPEYAIDEMIKKNILEYFSHLFSMSDNYFSGTSKSIKIKQQQIKILELMEKYYGKDVYCVLSETKPYETLYAKRQLNPEFIKEFMEQSKDFVYFYNREKTDFLVQRKENLLKNNLEREIKCL